MNEYDRKGKDTVRNDIFPFIRLDKNNFKKISYEEVHNFHIDNLAVICSILLNADINRYSNEYFLDWCWSSNTDFRIIFRIVYYG